MVELESCGPWFVRTETKEDGDWPDLAVQCEITHRSHVFLFILFTLRFEKTEQIARNGAADQPKATSLDQMQTFIFFRGTVAD